MTAKHHSRSHHSSSEKCPANKFSFLNGCMSWLKVLNFFGIIALAVILFLIYNTYNKQHSALANGTNYPHSKNFASTNSSNNISNINNTTNIKIPQTPQIVYPNDPLNNPSEGTGTAQSDRVKYDINLNIRDASPNVPNHNMISYAQYQADKDVERIINPILPPERSYENSYGLPINQPSRGPTGAYQQVGFLSQTSTSGDANGHNNENFILPLMGRPVYFGSRNWSYYTFSEKYQTVKLELKHKGRKCSGDIGCEEMYEGDKVHVPPYPGEFTVHLYDYDKPSYIPYVY